MPVAMPTLSLLAYVPSTGFLARFITPLKPLVLWWLGPEPPPDFYPARRHEKLNKRYRIQTKLGAGVWSSTWLVRDTSEVYNPYFILTDDFLVHSFLLTENARNFTP